MLHSVSGTFRVYPCSFLECVGDILRTFEKKFVEAIETELNKEYSENR